MKMQLEGEIVSIFHGDQAAEKAEEHFRTVFQQGDLPPEMPTHPVAGSANIVDILSASGLTKSKGEARRLIQQGGVRLNGQKVETVEETVTVEEEAVLQVGKRRFVKLVPSSGGEES